MIAICCKASIGPVPDEWPLILKMAGFEQVGIAWHREIGKSSVVVREGSDGRLDFALSPPIGSHSPEEHQTNAHAAAIQFKVLMTLAERANGRVIQTSLVSTCLTENASGTRLLAEYPLIPLSFDNLCLGFRTVLGGGVPQLVKEQEDDVLEEPVV